jgi:sensor histidine kinase YesM
MKEIPLNIFPGYYKSSKRKFYLFFSLALFLFFVALAIAFQHYYIFDVETVPRYSLAWHIPFNIFYFLIWLSFLPLIKRGNRLLQSTNSRLPNWLLFYFIFPTVLVFVHQLMAAVVINAVLGYMEFPSLIYYRMLRNPWIWEDYVIYFLIVAVISLENYQTKTDTHLLKASQLQSQLTQTQLRALKSQLHPHFLFNTLNTLSTLILKKDNEQAERMLTLLERFLTTTLNENEKSLVSLNEELKFIRHYLEIEKVRFMDKLVVEEEIEESALEAKVPVFLLQPLVENSIHHAVAAKTTDGIIKITSRREEENLILIVEDNGPGIVEAKKRKSKEGVGLKITKERLTQHYGENQTLMINESQLGGVRVFIKIPYVKVA